MQHADQCYAYSTILLAAAPLASQLASANNRWIFFFPLFAIPALTLMISVGSVSRSAAVQTFRKICPIAGGIGWAFTWHIAENLYVECLRASQLLIYITFSIRPSLNWAISCDHVYNSKYCHDFDDLNTTIAKEKYHYPDNFWPSQEFNRYVVRENPTVTTMPATWEPNLWYLGASKEEFYVSLPSIHLLAAHVLTWSIIYGALVKFYDRLGELLTKVFVLLPIVLYFIVAIGITAFGFHFTSATIQKELDNKKINEDPYDFWADLRGGFRTSISIVDYSSAFTGIVLLGTSRIRSGVNGLSSFNLVAVMMIVPIIQSLIRSGCEGHVSDIQPNYKIYTSTDETISFDLIPVCFATSSLGSLWSSIYFFAHYLYSSLGPMIVYSAFIYQSFIDEFPIIQNKPKKFIGLLSVLFFLLSIILYMPLGTKIVTFVRYSSQTSYAQLISFVVIFFVYGWQRLERDICMVLPLSTRSSLFEYLTSPTSPIITTLLFTVVPFLLCSKLVAVFDLLATGNEVIAHIDSGTQFLPFPSWTCRLIGSIIMFAPVLIIVVEAARTIYIQILKYKLRLTDTFKPTSDWMAHVSVNTNRHNYQSLAYVIIGKVLKIQVNTAVSFLLIFETVIGILIVILFFLNSVVSSPSQVGNTYRSCMLLSIASGHVYALFEIRRTRKRHEGGQKFNFYIAIATMETAMLNAYMWLFASDHQWGLDIPPLFIIAANTAIRGFCILMAIGAIAFEKEHQRPTNTREASEVDENDIRPENVEDDTPVIFDIAEG